MSEQQPQEVTTLLMRRCKVVWRLLLLFNFALGAYTFSRVQLQELKGNHGRKAHRLHKGRASSEVPQDPITASVVWNYDDLLVPATTPVAVRNPLLEEQQHEVLLWMLLILMVFLVVKPPTLYRSRWLLQLSKVAR